MGNVWLAEAADSVAAADLLCQFRDWWGYREPSDAEMVVRVERLMASGEAEFLLAGDRAAPAAAARPLVSSAWRRPPGRRSSSAL